MNLGDESRAYVAHARKRKAEQMAFLAWGTGITSGDMEGWADDNHWLMLAEAAQVNPPSPETRRMTITRLEEFELNGAVAA